MSRQIGFCVIYRFRLKEGMEDQFRSAWRRVTEVIRDNSGGLGSRLHATPDGIWLAYAQWPDKATWEQAGKAGEFPDSGAFKDMTAAIKERFPPILLDPQDDLLVQGKASSLE
jgi:quinol monooxygenase YgiN